MTKSKKKPSGICSIYRKLLERLPSTYPQGKLIVHASLTELNECYWNDDSEDPGDPGHPPFAYCDGNDNSIHVATQLHKETRESIIWYFLHEIGHLYAYQHYGSKDRRWKNYREAERYANQFASRWANKLKRERWI